MGPGGDGMCVSVSDLSGCTLMAGIKKAGPRRHAILSYGLRAHLPGFLRPGFLASTRPGPQKI